jgi:hypothetical protein
MKQLQINFKAKRIDNGEWVTGLVFNRSYRGEILTYIQDGDYAFKNGSVYGHEVDAATVALTQPALSDEDIERMAADEIPNNKEADHVVTMEYGAYARQLKTAWIKGYKASRTQVQGEGWQEGLPEFRAGWSNSEDVNVVYDDGVVSTGSYSFQLKVWQDYIYGSRVIHKIMKWQKLPTL